MNFYKADRPLYLETNVSGISLRVKQLQARDGMNYRHVETPNNAILHPTALPA